MKKTLLIKYLFAALLAGFCFAPAPIHAQQSPVVIAKRNSPYSPNPKRKIAAPTNAPTTEVKNSAVDEKVAVVEPAKIEKAEIPAPKVDSPAKTEEIKFQNTEFNNRPAVDKTAEAVINAVPVSPTAIYKIGVGDVLFISLQNAPAKESTYFTVLKDGAIDYPLAGEMVAVAGLTTDEIQTALQSKIKLYENPQIAVKVREHNSHAFTVLGMVERSGEKFLQREAMPLFVVRAESVVQSKANRAVVKRAGGQTETVDLRDKKYEDVLIFPGDIVEFDSVEAAGGAQQFYYIGGEIVSGGQKDFYKGLTLTQAILACGGLKKPTVRKVIVRRKNDAGLLAPLAFDLKAVKDGKSADPVLESGDTIEIGN